MIDIEKLDKEFVWHPFTQMLNWESEQNIVIERGEGVYLYDIHGNRYIDGVSSLWVNIFGHNNRELNEAIKEQVDKISHSTLLGLANVPSAILAQKLIEIAPKNLKKVFYSDSGSTSVEIALKVAFQYFKQKGAKFKNKKKIIAATSAYHGDTLGSVSVGGVELFHSIYKPLLFDTIRITYPYCYRCPFNLKYPECELHCAKEAEKVIGFHADEACALIIEPMIQGASGMITMPAGYMKRIEKACKDNNVLLILDEVATGFGRTGKMFAAFHEDIHPDVMCIAKGITGGYLPMAATLFTKEIYEGFLGNYEDNKTFFHGHTYTGNQLAASAAVKSAELFEKYGLLNKIKPLISSFEETLKDFKSLDIVGDIRSIGLMAGIELVKNRKTKETFEQKERIGHKVILKARDNGVIIRPLGDIIVIMPPLIIDRQTLDELLWVVYDSIKSININ
ncbi:MAG: adenosylmethionine--8-amino-7-oxononanoate transaminase [Deltaproteobacteria bacterium]|jgi:adenosylmethionine-8-amino-7-oxononanoate aminotransferase|nr:adenosylmethionine--8-amino-7-oxononanoate transaminase [Deltaproteobacteria bacterium]MCL5879646.1 adenosylmethionine--8-amino-7-oxononanoate transaminase [Deltaproteobacteria bacterium]MDA8304095.1 adenosylmethionine--8-amino-7-oxononanoate transaminase [Deltaproteobacteria bacterium]